MRLAEKEARRHEGTQARSEEKASSATGSPSFPSCLRAYVPSCLSRRPGFSLIEIMIVVVIIGIMAGVVTYATTGYLQRAKKERARSDIATYSGAVDAFYLANGRYPTNQEGLKVLTPDFIKVIQNDPWGQPYQYVQPGKEHPYDVVSYGADAREGGTGADADITNWDAEVSELKHK
jgi:general secretion pathway protein G